MNAVCPACGIAVVSGYVRCPRCHAGLPRGAGHAKHTAANPGGTAVVARGGFPISAVLVAVGVAAAIILLGFGMRGGGKPAAAVPPAPVGPARAVAEGSAARAPVAPRALPATEPSPASTAAQAQRAAAAELEDTLHRQRLWGRTEITGGRIDVRSGSCGEPAMRPAIEGKRTVLRGAGLTKLRCLEQSGAVIFERDL